MTQSAIEPSGTATDPKNKNASTRTYERKSFFLQSSEEFLKTELLLQDKIQLQTSPESLPLFDRKWASLPSVAATIVKMLAEMGVKYAFGVSGGAIAPVWAALQHSDIQVLHFRHEAGAAFAAVEASLASNRPVVVFSTAGPGITNALTGLFAARWEGAKVIFLSGSTSAPQRGRWSFQETSAYTMPLEGIFTSGKLFDFATTCESSDELPEIFRRFTLGLAQQGGFVAHLNIPTTIQTSSLKAALPRAVLSYSVAAPSSDTVSRCIRLLSEGRFAIWVGYGARHAASEIRQLAERTGAAVMCSPRGKGIFPENHPQFVGVTGFAGHESVLRYMREQPPLRTLVLGTRLSEWSSFWEPTMVPSRGFIHVDINPDVPGTAYPSAETFAIQSDVGIFMGELLRYFPESLTRESTVMLPRPKHTLLNPRLDGPVRPEILMDTIQRVILEKSEAVVMTEGGNSLAWGIHLLRFTKPGRYRVSTRFASMGHFTTGVLGAALEHNDKAIAIVGDGAMLMNNEVSTAVRYQIPAVWIVLNDGRYNMCCQGAAMQGLKGMDIEIPQADFVMLARGMRADGIRVEKESDVQAALEEAMASQGPFIVDVVIDPTRIAPTDRRIHSLTVQGALN